MAVNDYRKNKSVLHCVIDARVYVALKCFAADQGRSVTDVVQSLIKLEVESHGYVGVGSGDRALPSEAGGAIGAYGAGGGGGDLERGVVGRGVDFDAIIAAGRALKSASRPGESVRFERVSDPIEEIA